MTLIERILSKLFHHIDIGREDASGKVVDVYLRRWFIYPRYPQFKKLEPRVYLHKFYRGDDDRHLHSHPWKFTSTILWGGYWEHSFNPAWQKWKAQIAHQHEVWGIEPFGPEPAQTIRKWYGPGSVLKRGARWAHSVELPEGQTAWTLIRTGVKEQTWGFFTEGGFCNHKNYKNGVCWCHEELK